MRMPACLKRILSLPIVQEMVIAVAVVVVEILLSDDE